MLWNWLLNPVKLHISDWVEGDFSLSFGGLTELVWAMLWNASYNSLCLAVSPTCTVRVQSFNINLPMAVRMSEARLK